MLSTHLDNVVAAISRRRSAQWPGECIGAIDAIKDRLPVEGHDQATLTIRHKMTEHFGLPKSKDGTGPVRSDVYEHGRHRRPLTEPSGRSERASGDDIFVFKIDQKTGTLAPTGATVRCGRPCAVRTR